MTLRIMLVGLVASMGFDLPGGPDLSCWMQSGRGWVHARVADLTGPDVEADRPDAGPTDCRQAEPPVSIAPSAIDERVDAVDDTAFVEASEAMVAEFAADSMTMRDERSPIEDASAMLAGEAPPVGLPGGEEMAVEVTPVGEDDPADVIASDDVPGEGMTATDETPTRADRVSTAIRLSCEAVRAWTNLFQQSPDDACPAR
jgi:hypothetical protein